MAFDATNFMERCGDERVRNNAINWPVFHDFEEGSQAAENSFTHAMRYPTQSLQTAVSKWRFFIYDRVRACNGVDLGFALHAAQNSKSEAHEGFQTWDGGGLFGWPGFAHVYRDTFPSAHASINAVRISMDVINQYIAICDCPCKK